MVRSVETLTIRRMRPADIPGIEALYARCHPTWPARAPAWWQCMNTLLVKDGGVVLGMTSGSITLAPTPTMGLGGEWVMIGHDVCVDPSTQGRGLGFRLCQARLGLARAAGAKTFIGCTWPENFAMIRIFERQGLKPYGEVPNGFPHNEPPADGVIWIGGV